MVKIYYGNDYKDAMLGSPVYTSRASTISEYQKNYQIVNIEDITYEDIQYMSDEERLELYKDETGLQLSEVNDEFWDWAEENYL